MDDLARDEHYHTLPMNILVVCEGDAESPRAFSGTTLSILNQLRAAGDRVVCADADLKGLARVVAGGATISGNRSRWVASYHLGAIPFTLRSRNARRHVKAREAETDVVLQFGATFAAPSRVPYFVYCDSNIRMAERGRLTGVSWASHLEPREIDAIARREAEVYRGARAIFTISEYLRRSFIEDFGIPEERVHAVLAGPNFDAAAVSPAREHAEGPPTILFVGVHFERKGGDLLLEAFARVRGRIPDARLIIVGPRQLRLDAPGVTNLGFLRKEVAEESAALMRAYEQAHVFCMPTRYEPFGIAFVEAMLHGLPCIGPDAWAVPEMVRDGETGLLAAPDDVDAIADRLERLLLDPALARRMGLAGRQLALANFSWARSVAAMREVMLRR